MDQPAYCTILARNYLPVALALNESLLRHGDGTPLTIFLIDATEETELPDVPGVRWMHPFMLDLDERAVLELAMFYNLVEFATAVKPLVLRKLLAEHERAAYLDPDTYVVSPMDELTPALDDSNGIVLTPHFLDPVPEGSELSEGHLLHVGSYNLGFCAVDRRADQFLGWWWNHLQAECLHDPIAGLFVDQKWAELGSVFFGGKALRHYGYNVSFANLHERPIEHDGDEYVIPGTDDLLRLYHFHAFDPRRPELLTTRFNLSNPGAGLEALTTLAREYADLVLEKEAMLGPQPDYVYDFDTTGRRIARRTRHAYRVAALAAPGTLPVPFLPEEADAYERWRRSARGLTTKLILSDVAKGIRCAVPEEYGNLKRRLPGLTSRLRERFVEKSGMWE
jgi:hypothetical protein